MSIVRVQVTIPRDSAINADAVSNTFHFTTQDTIIPSHLDLLDIVQKVEDFYKVGNVATSANALVAFLSPVLDTAKARIRAYVMEHAEPRVPVYDEEHNLGIHGGNSLPAEVALAISYKGAVVSGVPRARTRGRIYLGPLGSLAHTAGAGEAVPTSSLLTAAAFAARQLLDASNADAAWSWTVYSRGARDNSDQGVPYLQRPLLPAIVTPVASASVDNAFDTQRRRGQKATAVTVA